MILAECAAEIARNNAVSEKILGMKVLKGVMQTPFLILPKMSKQSAELT